VRGLVASLRDRGLDATEGILFVLDGAKALYKAVRDVFGDNAVIARCRVHYAEERIRLADEKPCGTGVSC